MTYATNYITLNSNKNALQWPYVLIQKNVQHCRPCLNGFVIFSHNFKYTLFTYESKILSSSEEFKNVWSAVNK